MLRLLLTLLISISFNLNALADNAPAGKGSDLDSNLEQAFEKEFSQFDQRASSQFDGFNRANEAAFGKEFLSQWQQFNHALIDAAPVQPKPAEQPQREQSPITQAQNQTSIGTGSNSDTAQPPHTLSYPQLHQQLAKQSPDLFFGHPVPPLPMTSPLDMSTSGQLPRVHGTSPSALLDFRQAALGHTHFIELIRYFAFLRQRIQTDPYASLLLSTTLCRQQYADPNSQIACSWLLNQSQGFDVRLGLKQNRLLLLAASKQQWYENPFFSVAGIRYYVINKAEFQQGGDAPTNLQSNRHADATQLTQISLSRGLLPAGERLLVRNKFGQPINVDIDHVAYLFQLPQVDISQYLHDAIPPYLAEQLTTPFPPASSASAADSALKVQRTLQKLSYQIDEEQFGFEKPLTLSELIFFDYSDCEDRVYALAAIGRHFYQLRVGALRYPGHLSAAVMADGVWREADPTYLGAGLDMRQPTFANVEPERFY
jgi:hypothetical protein